MPELPEVETVARDLAAQARGRTIVAVEKLSWPRLLETHPPEAFCEQIIGRTITAAGRRAKWVLVSLSSELTWAVHLRMSGSLVVQAANHVADTHTHLVLRLDDGRQLCFRDVRKFGRMRLLDGPGLRDLEAQYGVEPLSESFTDQCLADLLAVRATRIKPFLLDQRWIAGLGNIYVDEALWHAKIHPERPAASLSRTEVLELRQAIVTVLTRSLELGGSSFRDYRNGYGEMGGNQIHFAVYRQEGQPCARCDTAIERTVVAQRGTHHCPTCQVRNS